MILFDVDDLSLFFDSIFFFNEHFSAISLFKHLLDSHETMEMKNSTTLIMTSICFLFLFFFLSTKHKNRFISFVSFLGFSVFLKILSQFSLGIERKKLGIFRCGLSREKNVHCTCLSQLSFSFFFSSTKQEQFVVMPLEKWSSSFNKGNEKEKS